MASGSPAGEQTGIQDEDLAQMKAFDTYQWQFDKDFLVRTDITIPVCASLTCLKHGALQITKGLDRPQALQALLQARLWWYQSKKDYTIQLPQYRAYEAARQQHEPDFKSPDGGILAKLNAIRKHMSESEEKRLAEDAAKVPGWQKYARKANLQLKADQEGAEIQDDSASIVGLSAESRGIDGDATADKGGIPANSGGASGEAAETAPYPEKFKHIAEAVVSGKQIPGVKLIPDTVIRPLVSVSAVPVLRYLR